MDQTTAIVEQQRRAGVRGSIARSLGMAAAIALVMAISGGGQFTDAAEWFTEAAVGTAVGLAVSRWVVPAGWFVNREWLAVLVIAASVTLPVSLLVAASNVVLHHRAVDLPLVLRVVPSVFGTGLVLVTLAFLIRHRPAAQTHAAPPDAPPAKFLARLPAKLKGAELYAVEAEDHYLRLHTSLGQDLILMRLSDAIAELEGLEGAQTHRSWWVAKGAVTEAERADGRAMLTLKDGGYVPVSRGFARQLRAEGWF
ncbi:MAG TPA: LytTR family DNA-binding domain-containing protein [Caulobacteraceae bacterium]|nr:LytTR family DNA-binding domain-containing protein [Caulobacteraceae bacterium]